MYLELGVTVGFFVLQSLQNSSYNHFAAIYYLLLERLKEYRSSQLSSRPATGRQQRPRSSEISNAEVRKGIIYLGGCICGLSFLLLSMGK